MSIGYIKRNLISVAGLVLASLACGLFFFQRQSAPKIAYAETSVLLSEFSEAIKARKQFEASQIEWDANLKRLNDTLNASMARMKTDYDRAKPSGRDSMRAALQQSNEDLQRYSAAVKKLAQDKEKELMDPIIKKMNGYLSQWGKEHGYSMILGTMAGGNILQANQNLNLTSRILHDLNNEYASKQNIPEKQTGKRQNDATPALAKSESTQ